MSYKRTLVSALTLSVALLTASAFAEVTVKATTKAKPATSDKAPQLTLVDPVKDFGTVPKGEKLNWTFAVKNNGTVDLEIKSASPSCGCTVADFDKLIKPGQTGKVSAHVDTAAFTGPITKHVTIQTNDPNTPSAQLTINATVKPYVEAYPAGFVRYNVLQGDAQTQTITLYSEDEAPFEITGIETPGDFVKVKYRKVEDEKERIGAGRAGQTQYKVDVTLGGPEAPLGPLAEKLLIKTNSKFQPEYQLSLTGVIRPTYMVAPTILNFGEIKADDSAAERVVTVQSNNKETPAAFQIKRVESSISGVTAQAKATDQPGIFEVNVKLGKEVKAGELNGTLKIYTTDSVTPVYTVKLKGMVKEAGK